MKNTTEPLTRGVLYDSPAEVILDMSRAKDIAIPPEDMNLSSQSQSVNLDMERGFDRIESYVRSMDQNLCNGVAGLYHEINRAQRKRKPKRINRQISTLPNKKIIYTDFFDDETCRSSEFILNASGPIQVYKLNIEEAPDSKWGCIFLGNSDKPIIMNRENLTATRLYDAFLKNGVCFNSELNPRSIGDCLYEVIAPAMTLTDNVWSISVRSGWHKGVFFTKENFPFRKAIDFEGTPIMRKELVKRHLTELPIYQYFHFIHSVRKSSDRWIFALYPAISLMASLLAQWDIPMMAVNMILMDDIPIKDLCTWFQVFNRGTLRPHSINDLPNHVVKEVVMSRDEIVLLDCRGNGYYGKTKGQDLRRRIINIWSGKSYEKCVPPSGVHNGLFLLSDGLVNDRHVINLFATKDLAEDRDEQCRNLRDGHVVDAVNTSYLNFVASHLDAIEEVVRNVIDKRNPYVSFDIGFEILTLFWQSQGIDFMDSMGVKEKPAWTNLFEDEVYEEDEIMDVFIKIMRKEIKKLCLVPKKDPKEFGEEIRYDGKYIWISETVFEDILHRGGLFDMKNKLLLDAKSCGMLLTDGYGEGYTRKLQVGSVRKERLQFFRTAFDVLGGLDIISLGGEGNV